MVVVGGFSLSKISGGGGGSDIRGNGAGGGRGGVTRSEIRH